METLESLSALARRVKIAGDVVWQAESAAEAAAWLALLCHYNACLNRETIPAEWLGFPANTLLYV